MIEHKDPKESAEKGPPNQRGPLGPIGMPVPGTAAGVQRPPRGKGVKVGGALVARCPPRNCQTPKPIQVGEAPQKTGLCGGRPPLGSYPTDPGPAQFANCLPIRHPRLGQTAALAVPSGSGAYTPQPQLGPGRRTKKATSTVRGRLSGLGHNRVLARQNHRPGKTKAEASAGAGMIPAGPQRRPMPAGPPALPRFIFHANAKPQKK